MNKILVFIILFLTVVGFIGGIGYSVYQSAWVIAAGQVIVGCMAWPELKRYWKKLID